MVKALPLALPWSFAGSAAASAETSGLKRWIGFTECIWQKIVNEVQGKPTTQALKIIISALSGNDYNQATISGVRCALVLQCDQSEIDASSVQKLTVRSLLRSLSMLKANNDVGISDGGKTVRYRYCCPARAHLQAQLSLWASLCISGITVMKCQRVNHLIQRFLYDGFALVV